MQPGRASETAYRAAKARAYHQVLDTPRVFDDPVAHKLLRPRDAKELQGGAAPRGGPLMRGLRMALAARSRIAEDTLHAAVRRGVRQYVLLGAGFDTFALRNPHPEAALTVFEVDHPSTQAAKREQLARAGLAIPAPLRFVPVDFAVQSLAVQLAAAGFRADEPAFFAFLGVSMYLEAGALEQTLGYIGGCAKGSEVVFDYVVAPVRLGFRDRLALRWTAFRCALLGEPWKSFLDPLALHGQMAALGFSACHDLGREEIASHLRGELPAQAEGPPRFGLGRLMRATV